MQTGWLPSTVELLEQDLTDALAIHEAIMIGLWRLRRAVKEMRPEPSPDRVEMRDPICA